MRGAARRGGCLCDGGIPALDRPLPLHLFASLVDELHGAIPLLMCTSPACVTRPNSMRTYRKPERLLASSTVASHGCGLLLSNDKERIPGAQGLICAALKHPSFARRAGKRP